MARARWHESKPDVQCYVVVNAKTWFRGAKGLAGEKGWPEVYGLNSRTRIHPHLT